MKLPPSVRKVVTFFTNPFYLDLRSLAFTRIFFGIVLMWNVLDRMQNLTAHYTDKGILDRFNLLRTTSPYIIAIHLINGSYAFQLLLFLFHFFVCFCLTIGWKTQLFSIIQFYFSISLYHSFRINNGGDALVKYLSFLIIFLPVGKLWSIDSMKRFHFKQKEKITNYKLISLGTIGVFIHVMILYMSSTVYKNGETWQNGLASYHAVSNINLKTPLAEMMRHWPIWLFKFMSFAVLKWEFYGPLFLISPIYTDVFRFIGSVGLVGMHLGFGITLRLGIFTWSGAATNLILLPSLFWDIIERMFRIDAGGTFVYVYNHSSLATSIGKAVQLFLPSSVSVDEPKNTESESSNLHDSNTYLSVQTSLGNTYLYNMDALIFIFKDLCFVTKPLGWILHKTSRLNPTGKLLQKIHNMTIYTEEEKKRIHSKRSYRAIVTWRSKFLKRGVFIASRVFLAIVLLGLILDCLRYTKVMNGPTPKPFSNVLSMVALRDKWAMFSPGPKPRYPVPVVKGTLADGKEVEFFHSRAIIDYTWKPSDGFEYEDIDVHTISVNMGNTRWKKVFDRLMSKKRFVMNSFPRYVCQEYNKRNRNNPLVELKAETVYFVHENLRYYQRETKPIFIQACPKKKK